MGDKQRVMESSMLGAGVLLVVALLGLVNYFGWKYHQRWDWTASELYTLSEKSEGVVAGLNREVEAIVFLSPADELYGPVSELLGRYEAATPRFSIRVVDPEKNLAEAQQLVDRFEVATLDVIVFASGDDKRVIEAADLAEYDYSGMQYGGTRELTAFKGEQVFTSTLLDLAESRQPQVLFTNGHGELSIDDIGPSGLASARQLLEQDNFAVHTWSSLGEATVPEGTDLIVIAGPSSTFVEPELELLRTYLNGGGRMLALVDPLLGQDGTLVETGLEALLADYGVTVDRALVIDPGNPLPFFGAETIFVSDYGDHPITKSLEQAQLPVIIPLARSVRPAGDAATGPGGFEIIELMRTSSEGWGETNLVDLDALRLDDDDIAGPVSLALAVSAVPENSVPESAMLEDPVAEGTVPEDAAPAEALLRLVVVGDSDFANNGQIQSLPNATLLANTFNWLTSRESLVGIPPKTPEQTKLQLTQAEARNIFLLVLVFLPTAVVGIGIAVFLRRRR